MKFKSIYRLHRIRLSIALGYIKKFTMCNVTILYLSCRGRFKFEPH